MANSGSPPATPASPRGLSAAALPGAGILALLLLLAFGRPPDDSFFWRTVFDLGHVPLFGVIGLLTLWIVRHVAAPHAGEWAQVVLALLATGVLSLLTEIAQIGQPGRQAEVGDAINNLTGAVCFVAIAAALRPGPWRAAGEAGKAASRLVLAAAVLALAIAFSPLATVAWSYAARNSKFPVVAELGAAWQAPLTSAPSAQLERVDPPDGWEDMKGRIVTRVRFLDSPWPGVTVREPWPDWSGYGRLRFRVWSDMPDPVQLNVRIDDGVRTRAFKDRYDGSVIVVPGANDFSIPLETVRRAPKERQMDLGRVSQFFFFTSRPERPLELYFSDVWLEAEWEEK